MPPTAAILEAPQVCAATVAVAEEARRGLTSTPKTLAPWLFYDETGSRLFEEITALPEYYLTRTERDLFTAHAGEIFHLLGHKDECPTPRLSDVGFDTGTSSNGSQPTCPITIAELGAGTAAKTGILLRALTRLQPSVLYQPIDISPTALDEARETIERTIPGVIVRPQIANYITESVRIERPLHTQAPTKILALYIGSSIGNFSPQEARAILIRLRAELQPGDSLLLGTDLAPGKTKSVQTLLAAYNDDAGVTAAFNRNILTRLNRELDANFNLDRFAHQAIWNTAESRIEMHLASTCAQTVRVPDIHAVAEAAHPALTLRFGQGETIHTENSYKFTLDAIRSLLADTAFTPTRIFTDPENLFALTLAAAV